MVVFNHIAHMYSKYLDFDNALKLFDEMPQRNVFSWTVMIVGSTDNGLFLEGLKFFSEMQNSGIQPDKFTYSALLQSCIGLGSAELGKMVHAQIVKGGFSAHVFLSTSLLNMYAKCGEIEESIRVFNTMNEHNQVSWNAMISGFASCDLHLEAFNQFIKMKKEGFTPNMYTFASVLKAVGKLSDVSKGREVHNYVTELGIESNVLVGTALIDMYSKCGFLKEARLVFDMNFTDCRENMPWNAMISGYSQGGCSKEALELLTKMCLNNIERDVFTFASTLNAVAASKCLQFGREVHAMVVKFGYDLKLLSVSNALADAYSKCGSLEDAGRVFERMEERDLVSWTTMVTAYATCPWEEEKAIRFFSKMREAGFTPNQFTFASILVGVSSLCLLEYGRQIHGLLCKAGMDTHECVESALIDMYAKCGSIIDAEKVFGRIFNMKNPDVVSWTAIISGYAQHGFANEALELFRRMEEMGIKANAVTLLSVLFACSHGGMVEEGLHYFRAMEERFGVVPEMEHYACVVDLLGRVGRLDDAVDFINKMPIEPTDMVWQTLLGACRVHGDIELGEKAAKKILSVRPEYSATYVLLSNTYIERGSIEDGLSLRNVMKDRGVKKEPGLSWISVGGTVHKFFSGDQKHPQKDRIYAKLEELRKKMNAMGYVPELRYVLQEAE
ncbi:Pentatricopeptide repeat [Macleaya cordata]|uniref:Pentatricopeptide repeat n=1 Tax=Macleaya cordata TaxID=56857 RepID=A0A200R3F5_MACCD|nr:Pentatricopeptide repeat [Macleaya cordata]